VLGGHVAVAALAIRYVTVDGRAADDLAGSVGDRGDRHRHLEVAPALSDPVELGVVDLSTTLYPLQERGHVIGPVRRHEVEQRHSQRLDLGVPVDPLGAWVPAGDAALEVEAEDRVTGGLDDAGEPLALVLLRLALGDVVEKRVKGPSIGLPHRRDRDLDWKLVPVPVKAESLEAPGDHAAVALLHERSEPLPIQLADPLGHHDIGEPLADHLVRAPAEDSLRGRIPGEDPTVGIRRDQRVGRALHDRAQSPLAGLDRVQRRAKTARHYPCRDRDREVDARPRQVFEDRDVDVLVHIPDHDRCECGRGIGQGRQQTELECDDRDRDDVQGQDPIGVIRVRQPRHEDAHREEGRDTEHGVGSPRAARGHQRAKRV
jgi:hypothetical protein